MIQEIIQAPNPTLASQTAPLESPDPHLAALLRRSVPDYAVGLAAPQIGILRQAILWRRSGEEHILWNPQIEYSGKTIVEKESCLSLPGQRFMVPRSQVISLQARQENWAPLFLVLEGWEARVIQHEVDHLHGILISDRGERVFE